MGKGDKRSRKGKIWKGSFGNTRRRKKSTRPAFVPKPKAKKTPAPVEAVVAETPDTEAAVVKAAKPKKVAAKKTKTEGEKKSAPKKKPATEEKETE